MKLESHQHCYLLTWATGHSQSRFLQHPISPPKVSLPKTLQEAKTLHVQEQSIFRVPRPLHRAGEKQPQLPLHLVPPSKGLLNLIWKQLEGSSLQETKKKKKNPYSTECTRES